MSRTKILSRPLALLGALALGVTACGGDDEETPVAPPEIVSFTASTDAVSLGGEVELRWETRNAKAVRIVDGRNLPVDLDEGASPGAGSVLVMPHATTTYRLIAEGTDGRSVSSDDLQVRIIPFPAPTITSFTVTPGEVGFAAPATLEWSTVNAISISIRDNYGRHIDLGDEEVGAGSVVVNPKADSVYTLTAVGRGGDKATERASVRIAQSPSVSIKAAKGTIVYGETTELIWSAELADHIVVQPEGGAPIVDTEESKSGTTLVQPTQSTIYVITATGKGGTESASVPVFVAPQVRSFSMKDPAPVRPGEEVTIEWEVVGATEITVTNEGGFSYEAKPTELVRGSIKAKVATTGMFLLIARSGNAESRKHLPLELSPEPAIRAFNATPSAAFAGQTVTLSWFIDGASEILIEARPYSLGQFEEGTYLDTAGLSARQDSIDVVVEEGTTFRLEAKAGVYSSFQDVHVDLR
ncbi:MAG TPA: hypothetical protein VN033_02950 [Vulgatibacter sp.]|nr:hypothetical protein [Vulgatibacter sp.]